MIKIVFYNRWHNGDLFLSKSYMQRLIQTLSPSGSFEFSFAHSNNLKLLSDLGIETISLNETDIIPVDDFKTVTKIEDTIYINTWVGAYKGFFWQNNVHSSIHIINIMWFSIFYTLKSLIGVEILHGPEEKLFPKDGVPSTDWSKFDIDPAKKFLENIKANKIILFSNGLCRSRQTINSNIDLMQNAINFLALNNPDCTFICTHKIEISNEIKNVYFTDDIFSDVVGGDINEIAFLSTFCDIIVGKPSGPQIYCNVQDNINRPCIFFTISDRQSDDYLYNLYDMQAARLFFVGKSEEKMSIFLNVLIRGEIEHPQFCIVDDEHIHPIQPQLDARNF